MGVYSAERDEQGCFVHASAVISRPVLLGRHVKIWQFATILEQTEIGAFAVIGSCCWIGRGCVIGPRSRLNHGCFIPNNAWIGAGVFLGPGVILTDDRYPRAGKPYKGAPPVIESGASIGAGAIILPGVTIGQNAMVGAGAVVSSDVPAGVGMRGEPARQKARTAAE